MTKGDPEGRNREPSRLEADHKSRVLVQTCRGSVGLDRALTGVRRTLRQVSEMGYALVLDLRAARLSLSEADAHTLMGEAENPWGWKYRVAVVTEDAETLAWLEFLAGVAPNYHVVLEVFEEIEEARNWAVSASVDPLASLSRKGVKILVVDDDPDILEMSRATLERAGFRMFTAQTAEECRELALREAPELILLDVVLGEDDGREVCRQLKAEPALRDTYIALASGIRTDVGDQVDGVAAGAEGYIPRPVGSRELVARVEILLFRRQLDPDILSFR